MNIKTRLVIFDCDGTLVNSEPLNNSVTASLIAEQGLLQYDALYCMDHFAGIRLSEIFEILEQKHNVRFPPDAVTQYATRVLERMPEELGVVPDALDTVRRVAGLLPACVASNGERSNVLKSLSLSGIAAIIPETLTFTANMVKNAKPAPDLFLLAAEKMGASPEDCLVIEDSRFGVQAARAANMRVLGFTGVHHTPELQAEILRNDGALAVIQTLPEIFAFL